MNASFFIYLFASCIGIAIVALLLLIFRVQAEKAVWKNLLMVFVIITFLLCLLYFMERFYTGNFEAKAGWPAFKRMANLLLGFGQIYVWCWYLRIKGGFSELWIRRGMNIIMIGILAVQMFVYLFLMDEHFFIASPGTRSTVTGMYILFMALQSAVLIGFMILTSRRVRDTEARRFMNGISLLLLVDFLWGNFYVIMLFRESPLLAKGLYAGFDFVSVTFLLTNLLVVLYVYRCEIRKMMPISEEEEVQRQESALKQSLREGGLSDRETEVALLLLEGASYDEIADQLTISKYTVKRHAHNIYQKLEVANKVELISKFR